MRDPKVTPAPGDVLRFGRFTRRVAAVIVHPGFEGHDEIKYWRNSETGGGFVSGFHCRLIHWRKWAKDAEVLTVGGAA